jgi:hypothetical protein
MKSADYVAGFDAAKRASEEIAENEVSAATKELSHKLAPSVEERTQVRKSYAEKIAREIRKLQP